MSISDDVGNPSSSTSGPFQGERTLFVWFLNYSIAAVTFGFTGSLQVLDLEPAAGFTNVGTTEAPELVLTEPCGLPSMKTIIAEITVSDSSGAGGELCIQESASTGRLCFQYCDDEQWYFPIEATGYASDGALNPCYSSGPGPGCRPYAIEGMTWGCMKVRYRR